MTYKVCMATIKYKDGGSVVAFYRLSTGLPFGLGEMHEWIMRDDPDAIEVSVSAIPKYLKNAVDMWLKQLEA